MRKVVRNVMGVDIVSADVDFGERFGPILDDYRKIRDCRLGYLS